MLAGTTSSSPRRQRRRLRKDDNDFIFSEMKSCPTATTAFLLLALGGCIATIYNILLYRQFDLIQKAIDDREQSHVPDINHKPDHTTRSIGKESDMNSTSLLLSPTATGEKSGTDGVGTFLGKTNTAIINQADPSMPPICSMSVATAVKQQLSPDECLKGKPYLQACSFTKATKGCLDPVWMAQHYAGAVTWTNNQPFISIFVRWPHQSERNGLVMRDLQLGSHNAKKYDIKRFVSLSGGSGEDCPVTQVNFHGGESKDVKVIVLEPNEDTTDKLDEIKQQMGLGNELIIEKRELNETSTLDKYVQNNVGKGPVHHLSIGSTESSYSVLMGSSSVLSRVRYLDFDISWKGDWATQSFSILIRKLKTRGFVCYFTGSASAQSESLALWRITDCWLSHYEKKHWGRVGCVNAHHHDVSPMAERMETLFMETANNSSIEY